MPFLPSLRALSPLARRRLALYLITLLLITGQPLLAQDTAPTAKTPALAEIALPTSLPAAPVIAPAKPGQYVLEFNRSPVVGNRLRFNGIYDEQRLHFTRPRNWQAESVKVLLRYRHSAALYATRSNLTVLINGTSIGSLPLNQPMGKIGDAVMEVPADLLQDDNELILAALQNNSPTCTQDPFDPSLWTEVLPDSKLVFNYAPQAVTPDFSQFPYPLFDTLSLQTNQIAYLQPTATNSAWLTATARLQTYLGRTAHYRPLDTRLVKNLKDLAAEERLVVLGTPAQQPGLADLTLPFALKNGKFVDDAGKPLPDESGLLMWSTAVDDFSPVLVITGNGEAGVAKAVQYLVQPQNQQIATGHGVVVNQAGDVPTPPDRQWPGYLPEENDFLLTDLTSPTRQPLNEMTVRGSHAPAMEIGFKALPDDRLLRGSKMRLSYSYGPQINPLTSMVDVELDGVSITGERLTEVKGANRRTLEVDLPGDRITPTSKLQVNFRLDPRERRSCSRVTDQQLWGTIHSDTSFSLKRSAITSLPDLDLFKTGYPFTAPQDLSTTAVVLPDAPNNNDVTVLLELAERLGRLSQADSVQLAVYRQADLPEEARNERHLVAIGAHPRFPLPELLTEEGFALRGSGTRQWGDTQVQPLPDGEGLMKSVISPWNPQRVVLALSGRDDVGLAQVADLLRHDPLFYQIEGDTVLVSAQVPNPDPYVSADYRLATLRQSPQVQLATTTPYPWLWQVTRHNWMFIVPATVALSLLLYGAVQSAMRRSGE
ncbi:MULTISPECIES: cellulose biosynthesis cyclic di-GMP-binding regulatory protein BcsB [Cyanophyceae]|uniref:Cellulose biosynthesis cyclic di-GMP-binding regulatory protein BcsB n=1 Tax=Leptolyngbya subtilissima DQ-A4 TaxID=2933933 RepID=A0ABV0K0Z9_9CYAN|nr:cellulose biosynthesis cyclic di-GMP-binding regulatory protein BcsB [Nodosilinea sp. FACHB-141]MBD2110965.1 cellulose biosynthesis cyclic di-GMP-binding regulatory protein BcsB [Nodosilinea sp. FACHB-141]